MPSQKINIANLPTNETLAEGLSAIAGALGGTVDSAMSDSSENAVQNKVIKAYVDGIFYDVNMSYNDGTMVSDKTFGEIKTAIDSGKLVVVKVDVPGAQSTRIYLSECAHDIVNAVYVMSWADVTGQIVSVSGAENDYITITA